jgi:2-dehydropantoate 2-reductase
MQVAIVGSGGVGGYFGGLLAGHGHEVAFLARGEHLRALRDRGLQVRSVHGDFEVRPARASEHPAEIGPVDAVVVGVKHYHLAAVAPTLPPLIGPETFVLPLLNGIDAHEALAAAVGARRVVGGLCSIVSMIEAPGVIRQPSQLRRIVVGELDGSPPERAMPLVESWRAAGVEVIVSDDIHAALWAKLVFIASFGGVSSLARANAGEVRSIPETRALVEAAMAEIEAVARAGGVSLAHDVVARSMAMLDAFEAGATPSMLRDVVDGKPFELEAFSGTVVRLARQRGVPAPVHTAIYALLLPALARAQA